MNLDAHTELKATGWPDDSEKPLEFDKLVKPLCKALRFAYSMRRQNQKLDVPWKGPGIGWRERATCIDAPRQLSAENLRYSKEEQGRDALEEIIGLAIRLGIEQGRRITMSGDQVGLLKIQAKIGDLYLSKHAETK